MDENKNEKYLTPLKLVLGCVGLWLLLFSAILMLLNVVFFNSTSLIVTSIVGIVFGLILVYQMWD